MTATSSPGAPPVETPPTQVSSPATLKLLGMLAVVGALYFGQTFVVPVLLGVLISYALNPVVDTLTRWRLPRTLATTVVLLSVVGATGAAIYNLSDEATSALENVPTATKRLRAAAREVMGDKQNVVSQLQDAADAVASAANGGGGDRRRAGRPLPVEVVEPSIDVKAYVWYGWRSLFTFAGQALLTLFLTFFMLSSGDLYRRKLVRLAGRKLSDRRVTVEILDEVGAQISHFLFHQVVTGLLVGITTWLAFLWLGMNYAALWGVAAGVLNSVPYFGPTVVAIAAFVAAFVQFDSAVQATTVGFVSLVITTLEGMLITPYLVSRIARMNPVAVFIGLLFWGWLWGVVGMLLAVPLLMVAKTVSDRIDDLKPVSELLGD